MRNRSDYTFTQRAGNETVRNVPWKVSASRWRGASIFLCEVALRQGLRPTPHSVGSSSISTPTSGRHSLTVTSPGSSTSSPSK